MALAAAVLFGLSTPLAKGMLADVSPQLLGGLFYLGSGLGLSILVQGRKAGSARAPSLSRRDALWLGGAILCGGVLAPPLQLLGIQRTPGSTASLLLNLESVFTALLAWIAFGEHVNRRTALGMLLITCGGIALSWTGAVERRGLLGGAAIAGACALWGLDNNLTQKVSGQDATWIALIKGLVAGIVNCTIALLAGARVPSLPLIARALAIGFFSYGLSLVLFVRALRSLGTARTGAYFSLAPFVGAAIGLVAWSEPLTVQLALAAALMGCGLWLNLTERHAHSHAHALLDHGHEHVHDEHHQHAHAPGDPPGEPHTHTHHHDALTHSHAHFPDLHHRHDHEAASDKDTGA